MPSAEEIDSRHGLRRPRIVISQTQLARDEQQVKLHLHAREKFTDAVTRTRTKRAHSEAQLILRVAGVRAIRIEPIRLLP